MDGIKAKEWEASLCGKAIDGWTVEKLIDYGKSAAVFRAAGPNGAVALKIFDDELIQRYGDKTQLERIHRELGLIGKSHPNMVQILGGGVHAESNNHYIVMEFLSGPSLAKCLHEVPEAVIPSLVEQLVAACEFLEEQDLAHRDIKPANIVILDDFKRLVLLDFGVLKPIGEEGLTDVDGQRLFIGTLQYSSPEFLLRDENNDREGWHALSLYQVGAVLHDLIVRRPIFEEFVNPYAALVNAVQHAQPSIASETVPSYLVDAAKMALVKDPEKRAELVNWDGFRPPAVTTNADAARQRIAKRRLLAEAQAAGGIDKGPAVAELLETVIDGLKVELRRIRQANASLMPPLMITREPNEPSVHVRMAANAELGLPADLHIDVAVEVMDVETQAVLIRIAANATSATEDAAVWTTIFKGPYSSAASSERLEGALLVSLDLTQSGKIGPLDLTELGVD